MKRLVLPPTIKKLVKNSLRGFTKLRDLYYCGTYDFNASEIITQRSGILRIHVSKYYPSSYFSDIEVTDHNLICDDSFICQTKYVRRIFEIYISIIIFILF